MAQLVEYRERFVGFETRVLEQDGDGPPFVLFHGYADSADTWRLVLAELARRGRAAVAVDFPGFGRADPLASDERVLPQLDRFAAAVIRSVGEPVVAVGNSLGGCAVLRAAEHRDLPLLGIVPVGPAGLGLAPWLDLIEANPLVSLVLLAGTPLPGTLVQAFVGRAYRMLALTGSAAVDPLVVRTFASHFADAATVRRYLRVARRLLGELHDPFDLGRVEVPTLAIWGRRDAMVPLSGSRRLLDGVAGSRLELMEACGHCPQVEDPAAFTELVVEFATDRCSGARPRDHW